MTTIEPGDTFLYPYPGDIKHLHIIIEKIIDKNVCLCVFVSSIRSGKGYDASCVLNAGDCSFIRHPSYVVYDKMQLFDVHHLTRMVENGQITIKERLEDSVLQRAIDGALKSKMTTNLFRKYLTKDNPGKS